MVDHHFANASQGAIGLIAAGGKPRAAATSSTTTSRPRRRRPIRTRCKGKLAFEASAWPATRSAAATSSAPTWPA